MSTFALRSLAALAAAFVLHGVQAQDAPAPAAPSGGGLGDWLKQLGKSADDALKAGTQGAQGAVDGVNKVHAAVNGSVRGRVALQGGKTATCFTGITACYLGSPAMTSPGQAQGVPVLLVLPDGRAVPNNADQLAHAGVLVLPAAPAAAAKGDTGYSDGLGCTDPSWTKDEIVRRRREIMDCQAEAITERAAQRAQARQKASEAERARTQKLPSSATGSTGGKADTGYRDRWGTGCVTPDMTGNEIVRNTQAIRECQSDAIGERAWQRSQAQQKASAAERTRTQKQLEDDTKAKFEAIQKDAAKGGK